MFISIERINLLIAKLVKARKNFLLYTCVSILFGIVNFNYLVIMIILLIKILKNYQLLTHRYQKEFSTLYNNIYEKNNYNNEKEIEKLLSVKAYFFFNYPFHKDAHQIYLYLKYFLFISNLMLKKYKKAYELVNEIDEFVEKYVINANKKINEDNEKISEENKRRRKRKKKVMDLLLEIDYPKDYTKEEIEGKNILFYLEDEKDEYAIKLKNLFLEKKKLYDEKTS